MEAAEDIVIAGAGLAGLAVALGLHRNGVRSVVLESSPSLRASGFAIAIWKNAFRALDALGVGDKIRSQHLQLQTLRVFSAGEFVREQDLMMMGKRGPHELRCVRRDLLLRALEEELPQGTIRYSSKIVAIEEDGDVKVLQLADGSVLRAKVLIGCDGINSAVANWLGLTKPADTGRWSVRGLAHYPDGHAVEPRFLQFVGSGFRAGLLPCTETDVYWFFTWTPDHDKGVDEDATELKQLIQSKLKSINVPEAVLAVIGDSDVLAAPLRFRPPLSLVAASISKGGACAAGDALHPMTPDLGQGGCCALEDSIVLARCLAKAVRGGTEKERVEAALREYAGARRWRSFEVVATAYLVGRIQQSDNAAVSFLRDKVLAGLLSRRLLDIAEYDCGTLDSS